MPPTAHGLPSIASPLGTVLPPHRPGAPRGNKNAFGHGAPRGNKNGVGHGAPRGNRNALKFGVYTRAFTRPMIPPLGTSLLETLEREEHRIRHYIRDELASVRPASLDFRSHLALLRAVTIAVGRLRRLHRHILRLQAFHAFDSDLSRSIARKLHLFPADEQEPGLSAPLFSRSPLPVRGGAGGGVNASPNNCLLVPLFSQEQKDPGPPTLSPGEEPRFEPANARPAIPIPTVICGSSPFLFQIREREGSGTGEGELIPSCN